MRQAKGKAVESEQACGRPDCDQPQSPSQNNEYFVERIIGRKPYDIEWGPRREDFAEYIWLVKYEGYVAVALHFVRLVMADVGRVHIGGP